LPFASLAFVRLRVFILISFAFALLQSKAKGIKIRTKVASFAFASFAFASFAFALRSQKQRCVVKSKGA
jgi:hypothetical protein